MSTLNLRAARLGLLAMTVALLADRAGEHMRCHFTLMHPHNGMAGGGAGECQLPSGQTIDATFANS